MYKFHIIKLNEPDFFAYTHFMILIFPFSIIIHIFFSSLSLWQPKLTNGGLRPLKMVEENEKQSLHYKTCKPPC